MTQPDKLFSMDEIWNAVVEECANNVLLTDDFGRPKLSEHEARFIAGGIRERLQQSNKPTEHHSGGDKSIYEWGAKELIKDLSSKT